CFCMNAPSEPCPSNNSDVVTRNTHANRIVFAGSRCGFSGENQPWKYPFHPARYKRATGTPKFPPRSINSQIPPPLTHPTRDVQKVHSVAHGSSARTG